VPSRVRESIFNMLHGHIEGEAVFDGFAGVGSFGIEALSRGATNVVMVERDRTIARLLRQNIDELRINEDRPGEATIINGNALGPAALAACPQPVHIVFFDPPYPLMWDDDQRARVLAQFALLAARLDDTGFALLRTPWPLRAPASKAADADDEDESGESTPEPDQHGPRPDAADELHGLPGLDGPETHVYGSMAVHWYMRSRSGDGSGG
jgi:16S rRNA (guanine966-N2)-methyltransferase